MELRQALSSHSEMSCLRFNTSASKACANCSVKLYFGPGPAPLAYKKNGRVFSVLEKKYSPSSSNVIVMGSDGPNPLHYRQVPIPIVLNYVLKLPHSNPWTSHFNLCCDCVKIFTQIYRYACFLLTVYSLFYVSNQYNFNYVKPYLLKNLHLKSFILFVTYSHHKALEKLAKAESNLSIVYKQIEALISKSMTSDPPVPVPVQAHRSQAPAPAQPLDNPLEDHVPVIVSTESLATSKSPSRPIPTPTMPMPDVEIPVEVQEEDDDVDVEVTLQALQNPALAETSPSIPIQPAEPPAPATALEVLMLKYGVKMNRWVRPKRNEPKKKSRHPEPKPVTQPRSRKQNLANTNTTYVEIEDVPPPKIKRPPRPKPKPKPALSEAETQAKNGK